MAYDPNNVFAKILRGELPCERVYEDDKTLAFMDIMPRADGHVLVIPKTAGRTILDTPLTDLQAAIATVQRMARAVKDGMQADGITIQQFNEAAGGQVVFHLHFHILPRWDAVTLRAPGGPMARQEDLARHAARIRAALGTG